MTLEELAKQWRERARKAQDDSWHDDHGGNPYAGGLDDAADELESWIKHSTVTGGNT